MCESIRTKHRKVKTMNTVMFKIELFKPNGGTKQIADVGSVERQLTGYWMLCQYLITKRINAVQNSGMMKMATLIAIWKTQKTSGYLQLFGPRLTQVNNSVAKLCCLKCVPRTRGADPHKQFACTVEIRCSPRVRG